MVSPVTLLLSIYNGGWIKIYCRILDLGRVLQNTLRCLGPSEKTNSPIRDLFGTTLTNGGGTGKYCGDFVKSFLKPRLWNRVNIFTLVR